MNPLVKKFVDAAKANDDEKAVEAAGEIASVILNDIRRIADALETIAKKSAEQK